MPLTKEQLLIQRYKVIAVDTSESFEVGELLNHPVAWHDYIWQTASGKIIFYPEKYPHLFQPLPWWSDRKLEDMPHYLNCPAKKAYYKVDAWNIDSFVINGKTKRQYGNYLPATEEEYNAYVNQKQ